LVLISTIQGKLVMPLRICQEQSER